MIQRVQSLYLALIVIISAVLIALPIISLQSGETETYIIKYNALQRINSTGVVETVKQLNLLSVVVMIIPVMAVITILLFKKRHIQMKLAIFQFIIMLLLISLLLMYIIDINRTSNASIKPGIVIVLPFFMLVFNALAYRGIKKDEELVRSFDRLR
jgi:4-amino-4-deoxy-L-arabinose transferase-like glycosyltransferase